jgi:hypothetical protein
MDVFTVAIPLCINKYIGTLPSKTQIYTYIYMYIYQFNDIIL